MAGNTTMPRNELWTDSNAVKNLAAECDICNKSNVVIVLSKLLGTLLCDRSDRWLT